MSRPSKLLELARRSPTGLSFTELQRLVEAAGFTLIRIAGDHHVYTRQGIVEIINLQPKHSKAKVYQVKQVLALIDKYSIVIE